MSEQPALYADGALAFRVISLRAESARTTLVLAERASDGARVLLKSPNALDPEAAALRHEASVLLDLADGPAGPHVVPAEPLVELSPGTPDYETGHALVLPDTDSAPLPAHIGRQAPAGLAVEDALNIAEQVARALEAVHAAGYVHRRLSPEHVLIDAAGRVTLCGLAGATKRGQPHPVSPAPYDALYTAPEAQREQSGRFFVPRADVYSFGLLLAYLVTGERPTGDGETPFTRRGHARLLEAPRGIALLVGRCTQPLQKNRFGSMRALLPFLTDEAALPTERTEGFGPIELVATWAARSPSELPVGRMAPGPLVDRPRSSPAPPSNMATMTEEAPNPSEDEALFDGLHHHDDDHDHEPPEGPGPRALRYAIMAGIVGFALWAVARNVGVL